MAVRCGFCPSVPDTVGEGGRALLAWFDLDEVVKGLAVVHGWRDREFARCFKAVRELMLVELRRTPERITRWWNR